MPKCFFCNHKNPDGVQECQECGAELEPPDRSAATNYPIEAASEEMHDEPIDPFDDELLQHLQAGNKIAAVKAYRDQTGAGLKDSVEAINALATKHDVKTVYKSGCSVSTGVLAVIVAIGLWSILS